MSWTLLNTLYVMTSGSYLHLDNDTVRIEVEHETRLRVPLHHLGAIVCSGDILISPALIGKCAEKGICITLLDRNGRFRARIEGPVSGNVMLRQAQFAHAGDPARALALARNFVAGKLRNSRSVLLRGAREAKIADDQSALGAAVAKLDASLRATCTADGIAVLRGIEGEAARTYFEALSNIVRPNARREFAMEERTRRPPRDRMNALLSFVYTLLIHDCRAALEAVGLDPQVGFLHVLRPGRPALALDLVEEFRAIVADRVALTLINRGQLRPGDFRCTEGGAVLMNDDARRTISLSWQDKKRETLIHPLLDTRCCA